MTEYIDKIKLIEAIRTYRHNDEKDKIGTLMLIEMQPTADVAPVVHGKWEQRDYFDEDSNTYVCSVCDETWTLNTGNPKENNMYYCPNCGAKMDLGDKRG